VEEEKMRARDISMFVICVALAAPLVTMTGVFGAGPVIGPVNLSATFAVSGVVGVLIGGGLSIMGWSFKVPVVLTLFGSVYAFSSTLIVTLVAQMIRPWEVGTVFSAVFVALFMVVGYFAALELAGGPHGIME
jgi:hypothetical protein